MFNFRSIEYINPVLILALIRLKQGKLIKIYNIIVVGERVFLTTTSFHSRSRLCLNKSLLWGHKNTLHVILYIIATNKDHHHERRENDFIFMLQKHGLNLICIIYANMIALFVGSLKYATIFITHFNLNVSKSLIKCIRS